MTHDSRNMDDLTRIAALYRRFASNEAQGRSPLYEELTNRIADDADILAFLAALPEAKRQPNLLLGAVAHLNSGALDWSGFRAFLARRGGDVRALMLARSTQTNEPGRCAVLLPVLARLAAPLALIEVGASAGLCLLPDRYGYDYGTRRIAPPTSDAPVFPCAANAATPLSDRLPEVVWRAGLDLDPIDVRDAEQTAWLESLVWPEQQARRDRLRQALAVARRDPPRLVRGDLRDALPQLAAEAPRGARLVVFHTAVLAYVTAPDERAAFTRTVKALDATWIANEVPGVFPDIAAKAPSRPSRRFLLSVDGEPVAWTDPHGAAIDWITPPA
jgi:hypothetical protein